MLTPLESLTCVTPFPNASQLDPLEGEAQPYFHDEGEEDDGPAELDQETLLLMSPAEIQAFVRGDARP